MSALPIFQIEGGVDQFTHVDLAVHEVPPEGLADDVVAWVGCFLSTKITMTVAEQSTTSIDSRVVALLHNLGVPERNVSDVYLEYLLPRLADLPSELRDRAMRDVLCKLPLLGSVDDVARLEAALRDTAFVPSGTSTAQLHRPSELFDPDILRHPLGLILEEGVRAAHFPHPQWGLPESGELHALRTLGLRQSLTRSFICDMVGRCLEVENCAEMAEAILRYLSTKYTSLSPDENGMPTEAFASKLCELEWLPVLTAAPIHSSLPSELQSPRPGACEAGTALIHLPWSAGLHASPRASARAARPAADAPLVSATTRVLALPSELMRSLPSELMEILGWSQPPALSILLAQLDAMAKLSVDGLSRRTQAGFNGNMQALYKAIESALHSLTSKGQEPSGEEAALLRSVGSTACVWLEERHCFVAPRRVARRLGGVSLCFEPHLFSLPPALSSCQEVTRQLGVREAFDATDYTWASRESRTTPFDKKPPAAKLLALCQGDREGADEAFMSSSIINEIKLVLQHYPDGDTVLTELLQNADESGATVVRFVLDDDSVQHSTASLWPQLQEHVDLWSDVGRRGGRGVPWQGPALYCFNDGSGFSDDDFSAIRHAESKGEQQSASSSRFTIGFNSVYHLTDAPALLSNGRWCFFDPHRWAFANGGTEVSLAVGEDHDVETASNPADFADQFAPLCLFGGTNDAHWDMQTKYRGALIRLPLRRADDSSKLGDPYSHDQAYALLERLRTRGPEMLLFLTSVRRIEVYARASAEGAVGAVDPQLRFCVERHTDDGDDGRTIAQLVQGASSREQLYAQLVASAPTLESRKLRLQVVSANGALETESRWQVCSALTLTEEMHNLCLSGAANGLKMVPWGGVAARIDQAQVKGVVFSFLPLPIETGLPVHVNGHFEVTPDRGRLCMMQDGLEGVALVKARWNQFLASEVISLCYCEVLTALAVPLETALKQFFSVWPADGAQEPWIGMVTKLYHRLALQPILPGPESWLRPALADGDEQQPKAVLRAEQDRQVAEQGFRHQLLQTANEQLARAGIGVLRVVLPSLVLQHLQKALDTLGHEKLKQIGPHLARHVLRRSETEWPGKNEWLLQLKRSSGVKLLRYCLSSETDLELNVCNSGKNANRLSGLPLVPILAPPEAPPLSRWAQIMSPCSAPRLALLSSSTLDKLGLCREAARRQPTGWVDRCMYEGLRIVDAHALKNFENGMPFDMLRSVAKVHMTVPQLQSRQKGSFCTNVIFAEDAAYSAPPVGLADEAFRVHVWISTLLAEGQTLPQLREWASTPANAAALRRWVAQTQSQLSYICGAANERNSTFTRDEVSALKSAMRKLPVFDLPPAVQSGLDWHRQVSLLPRLPELRGDANEQPQWWRDVIFHTKELAGAVGERWLLCVDLQEQRVFEMLDLQRLSCTTFYAEEIFPRLPELAERVPEETSDFIKHVLLHADLLASSQGGAGFLNSLRGLACVRSPFGLLRISDLTHPNLNTRNIAEFDAAFVPSDMVLPHDVTITQLESVGLGGKAGFLAAARRVDSDRAAVVVWECLVNNHATLLRGAPAEPDLNFLHELMQVLKLPVMVQGEPGMPWPANLHAQPFAPLSLVQPHERRFLVSATHRVMLAQPHQIPQALYQALGWHNRLKCEVVLEQLRAASLGAGSRKEHMLALYKTLNTEEGVDWSGFEAGCGFAELLQLSCVMVSATPDDSQEVALRPPQSVAFSLQHHAQPASNGPTRYICLACRSTQLSATSCNNKRCPGVNSHLPEGLVATSEPSFATYSLNRALHEVHPECAEYEAFLARGLGVKDHFTLQEYSLAPHHFTLQCAVRRYLARRRIAARPLQTVARGFLARRRCKRLRMSLAGEAFTAVHTAVQRTGRSSASLLLCSVIERLPEVRCRRREPDKAALAAFDAVSRLLAEEDERALSSAASPGESVIDENATQALSSVDHARRAYHEKQQAVASATDDELQTAQSARDTSRAQLIAALGAAEHAKLRLAPASSDRELAGMVRVAEQRQCAFEDAARAATQAAAELDPRLGSRAEVPRHADEAMVVNCKAAMAALDHYASPAVVKATEAAAKRCTNAMHSIDLFCLPSSSGAPAMTGIKSELRALGDALAAESGFWKSYSTTDAFPSPILLAACRTEAMRLAVLAERYSGLLAEASQLAAERAMQQEAASTGSVQPLLKQLRDLQDKVVEEQDNLEDAATKLRRATRANNPSGDPVSAEAAQVAARAAVNALEKQQHEARARAHEQLQLFPELARGLATAIPFELAPIYRANRTLHQ